jgi:hypothetical protein
MPNSPFSKSFLEAFWAQIPYFYFAITNYFYLSSSFGIFAEIALHFHHYNIANLSHLEKELVPSD